MKTIAPWWPTVCFALGCAVNVSGLPGASDSGVVSDAVAELCPSDPDKDEPGVCGCGTPDSDGDGDGIADCLDGCPEDPEKADPGQCGCGNADVDGDGDGTVACLDCDDSDPARAPAATETCNGSDDDCDGSLDEAPCVLESGCADGTREGFRDRPLYPEIAACAGAFEIRGILTDGIPSCDRAAGNDGSNSEGSGCDADDLCAEGWSICPSPVAVASASGTGCLDAVGDPEILQFYAAGATGVGGTCSTDGTDGVFGCGNAGTEISTDECGPLNRRLDRPCGLVEGDSSAWNCVGHLNNEANTVLNADPRFGGILCCKS